ncbi:hypothetical protein K645_1511 [Blattabacterium sp. (Nauphoeta cinerea)]|uniref:porin n=1 Tax=Blattabacterium sp. (Nauphoeta cinerea) TaxID=1316444 RepID=UPI0003B0F613|nr:porin [Blattabacterium sp. (Nauphoeta cinerea)]AGW86081.1 hypothetical protein K645_1511 [Blattabacterium sp. (Nauphoeta cinerea)]
MKKTKITLFILFLGFFCPFHSYSEIIKQKKTTDDDSHSNMFLDFSSSLNSTVKTVKKEFYEGSRFSENYLNLEIIGKANDKISYRFTKQLKKTENSEMMDLAYLKYKWNDKLYLLIGKQPFSFGSMEYANANSSYAYRYPHVYKKKENPVGFSFLYIPIKDHELQFQIVNGTKKKEDYITKKMSHPMGCSVNWNWSLFNNKIIKNRWSYSIFQENENKKFWKLLALGSQLNFKPLSIEADYIFSDEDIEKNGRITNIIYSLNNEYYNTNHAASVKYGTYLVKLKYNFLPKWNFIAKGVYEIGTSKKEMNDILVKNKLFKKAYTYYGGVEFLPIMKSDDLSLHLIYQNHRVNYSLDPIKKENENNHIIILGFSYRVKMI